jgi:hypothetical protein
MDRRAVLVTSHCAYQKASWLVPAWSGSAGSWTPPHAGVRLKNNLLQNSLAALVEQLTAVLRQAPWQRSSARKATGW